MVTQTRWIRKYRRSSGLRARGEPEGPGHGPADAARFPGESSNTPPIDRPMPQVLLGAGGTPAVAARSRRHRKPGTHRAPPPPDPVASRRIYLAVATGLFLWTAYVSFLPFDWQPVPIDIALFRLHRAFVTPVAGSISRTDALANTLLFVPVGFALAGGLLARTTGLRFGIGAIVVALLSLSASLFVEFGQIFLRDRVPSAVDVTTQTLGNLIGIALWANAGHPFTCWAADTWSSRGHERLPRVLAGLAGLWLLFSFAPFDISFDLGELVARWRAGQINPVPFGGGFAASSIADGLLQILGTIAVGAFALLGAQAGGRRRSPATAIGLGVLLVAAVEFAQVFGPSHAADASDIVYGAAGVALGVWIARNALSGTSSAAGYLSAQASRYAVLFVAIWTVALFVYFWLPLTIFRSTLTPFGGRLAELPSFPSLDISKAPR